MLCACRYKPFHMCSVSVSVPPNQFDCKMATDATQAMVPYVRCWDDGSPASLQESWYTFQAAPAVGAEGVVFTMGLARRAWLEPVSETAFDKSEGSDRPAYKSDGSGGGGGHADEVPAEYWRSLPQDERGELLNLILRVCRLQGCPQRFPCVIELEMSCPGAGRDDCQGEMVVHGGALNAAGADAGGRRFASYECDPHSTDWLGQRPKAEWAVFVRGFEGVARSAELPVGAPRVTCYMHPGGVDVCLRCSLKVTLFSMSGFDDDTDEPDEA